MPGYDRVDRQAEELKRGLDSVIRNQVKDPRIPEVFSITNVDTKPPLIGRAYCNQCRSISLGIILPGCVSLLIFFRHFCHFFRLERLTGNIIFYLRIPPSKNIFGNLN